MRIAPNQKAARLQPACRVKLVFSACLNLPSIKPEVTLPTSVVTAQKKKAQCAPICFVVRAVDEGHDDLHGIALTDRHIVFTLPVLFKSKESAGVRHEAEKRSIHPLSRVFSDR
jgi:hypothetical protein